MKIAILSTNPCANKGSMGRLEGMIMCIRREIPQSEVTILHRYHQKENATFGKYLEGKYPGIILKPHPWFNESGSNIYTGINSMIHFLAGAINCKLLGRNCLDEYDFIVDINFIEPDMLTSEYDPEAIVGNILVLLNAWYAVLSKKPIMICSATIGPYKNICTRNLAPKILNKVKAITLREPYSVDYLSSIGVTNPQIHLSADLTFLLEASSIENLPGSNDAQKLGRPIIGIVPTAMMHPVLKESDYISLMAELIETIVTDMNATVIMITNTYQDESLTDSIYEKVHHHERVKMLPFETSASETKAIIGICDAFICSRFHALVASTAMGVPSLGIVAYSYNKFHGIIGRMMEQEEYLIDIDDSFEYDLFLEKLKDKTRELLKNSKDISNILTERQKLVLERGYLNGHLIKKIIEQQS